MILVGQRSGNFPESAEQTAIVVATGEVKRSGTCRIDAIKHSSVWNTRNMPPVSQAGNCVVRLLHVPPRDPRVGKVMPPVPRARAFWGDANPRLRNASPGATSIPSAPRTRLWAVLLRTDSVGLWQPE